MIKKDIIIYGIYPPPYGGISVHVKRLKQFLDNENIKNKLFNESNYTNINQNIFGSCSLKNFIFKMIIMQNVILHFQSSSRAIKYIFFFLKLFNKKIVYTIHGERQIKKLKNSSFFIRNLIIFNMRCLDKIICVNPDNVKELLRYGINTKSLVCIPSFIKPTINEKDLKEIPDFVWNFIDNSEFLICANGNVRFFNEQDLYGFDLLIELALRLLNNSLNVNILIAVLDLPSQNKEEEKYYHSLKLKIKEMGLSNIIMFYEVSNSEFYPILTKSKLFIRPTNTDGYGVSVAEAIFFKTPAIASNVCTRPNGTILFNTRDIDDLYLKVFEVINNYEKAKKNVLNIEIKDYSSDIVYVYQEL